MGKIIDQDLVAEELKGLLLENKIGCKDAACALSSYTAIIKKVQVPFLKVEELEETIRTEAEAVIPFSLNEIYYSYYIMGVDEEISDMMNVQIVAVKKEIVDNFIDVFQRAGLRLHILDVDVFGVASLVEQIMTQQSHRLWCRYRCIKLRILRS
jgi:type IV pilus assembly protein PilM